MVVTLRAVARTRSSATWARPGPAGIPLAAAGAMGRAPWRRAPARTPPDAAARTFLADPLRAAGGAGEGGGLGAPPWGPGGPPAFTRPSPPLPPTRPL